MMEKFSEEETRVLMCVACTHYEPYDGGSGRCELTGATVGRGDMCADWKPAKWLEE